MASSVKFKTFSPSEVCTYLEQEIPTLSQEVLMKFEEHKIDGEVCSALTEEFLREIAPLLGDQLEIKRVLDATQLKVSSVRVVFFA